MSKAKDLRDKTVEELEALYQDSLKTLFKLKNELNGTAKPAEPHKVPQTRREIARLLTVITQKRGAKQH